jgi:hypothetical protein
MLRGLATFEPYPIGHLLYLGQCPNVSIAAPIAHSGGQTQANIALDPQSRNAAKCINDLRIAPSGDKQACILLESVESPYFQGFCLS